LKPTGDQLEIYATEFIDTLYKLSHQKFPTTFTHIKTTGHQVRYCSLTELVFP